MPAGQSRRFAPSLKRPLYRGELVYGRTAKAYGRELRKVFRGTKREKGQIRKPEETWIRRDAPELRIVDADVAERVDARLQDRRERYAAAKSRNDGRAPHKTHGKYLLSGGMLICPTCGGHFEARKYPWRVHEPGGHAGHVYICSTRRRKPGTCSNTLALPIADADDAVLSTLEGEVIGTRFIRELLSLVDTAPDETEWLTAERERRQIEIDRLVASIAAGVPGATVAPLIRDNEAAIRKLDAQLRKPRLPRLGQERLRAALEQRAAQWKADLRAEPNLARMVLRRLVAPLTLWEETVESPRPKWIEWKAEPKTDSTGRPRHPSCGVPSGIRTRVLALKGPRPRPLDDGDWKEELRSSDDSRRVRHPSNARRTGTGKKSENCGGSEVFDHPARHAATRGQPDDRNVRGRGARREQTARFFHLFRTKRCIEQDQTGQVVPRP